MLTLALRAVAAAVVLAVAVQTEPLSAPVAASAEPFQEGTATLKGVVKLKGPIPKRQKIATNAEPKCASFHPQGLFADNVVADPTGRLQWVFVYLKTGLNGKTYTAPKKPVMLDQKSCRYDPHVLGVMVGQDLMIRNGDDMVHISHVVPRNNKEWGFSQAKMGEMRPKVFDKSEVMIRVFCDVHPWMSAYVGVLDHPLFDVTDPAGRYEIKGLPPGKHTIEFWHEVYKSVEQEIEVKARETKTLNVDFTDKK